MSYPPMHTRVSVPIPQSTAQKVLSAFLTSTSSTPYLLPGARLEPTGPAAGSSASPVIYNLQRVEAGLRGEWMAPVLELNSEEAGGDELGGAVKAATGVFGGGKEMSAGGEFGGTGEEGDKMDTEGWQDLDEYQREQSIEEGEEEAGPRVVQEGDEGFEAAEEMEEAPKVKRVKTKHEGKAKVSRPLDKETRKKDKKERLKALKKRKHLVKQEAV